MNSGKEFEDSVVALFSSDGRSHVEREQIVGHKKVDVLVRQHRFGASRTIAVECKDYSRALTRGDVQDIWLDYEALVARGLVDEVLIVPAKPAAAGAFTYAKERMGLSIQDFASLIRDTLGMEGYMKGLVHSYYDSPDGISHYYMAGQTAQGIDIEELIVRWIDNSPSELPTLDSARPVAILGAYGIGKSSFASHLAARLAKRALDDPTQRMPVLIRLGEISGEQSVQGLLGRHFTYSHHVPGYNYSLFQALNRNGRLVVILDGFDEMKQMLLWREFKHNLRELNRLHLGDARLLLLGRPTAFETDEEQGQALHGQRTGRFGVVAEAGWPDYQEVQMNHLDRDQIPTFLRRYLGWRHGHATPTLQTQLEAQVSSKHLRDVAKRPVQLRMLADILPNYTGEVEELDLSDVYGIFIDQLIDEVMDREEEKHSRLRFSASDRRLFLSRLAYWLWTQNGADIVTTDQIPLSLIEGFADDEDPEAVRRDLVLGSPLDRRPGERIRFAHRSFQEFLVAEALVAKFGAGELSLGEVEALLSIEVAEFVTLLREDRARKASLQALISMRGSLSWRLINCLLLDPAIVGRLRDQEVGRHTGRRRSPWEVFLLVLWADTSVGHRELDRISRDIVDSVKADDVQDLSDRSLLAAFSLLLLWTRMRKPQQSLSAVVGELWKNGEHESFTGKQLAARRLIHPYGDYIGDLRDDRLRIGIAVGKQRLVRAGNGERIVIEGGEKLDVNWLPTALSDLATKATFIDDETIDVQAWRSVFAARLRHFAFVRDWIDDDALASDVKLSKQVEGIDPQLTRRLREVAVQWRAYTKHREAESRSPKSRKQPVVRGGG